MTINAYLFMWNCHGIESIVPITEYEDQMKLDAWVILKGETPGKNPIDDIVGSMIMRARFNAERNYEIYAMDCEEGITREDLFEFWDNSPQSAADITREKGICLFTNRNLSRPIQIT
jgi:hypothetical protein